jgi:hypothetical protein
MVQVPLGRLPDSSQFVPIKLLTNVTQPPRFAKLGPATFSFMQIPIILLASRGIDETGTLLTKTLLIFSYDHEIYFNLLSETKVI